MPSEFRAEAVVAALLAARSLDEVRVLLPRADIGREVVADEPSRRRRAGHGSRRVSQRAGRRAPEGGPDIYRMLLDGEMDVVTFTSASAVRNFARMYGAEQAVGSA